MPRKHNPPDPGDIFASPKAPKMADIVNLNHVRKAKQREEDKRRARERRVKWGRIKADRERERMLESKAEKTHEGHRREKPEKEEE
jgi:Domain of unknown function (DUF4169)